MSVPKPPKEILQHKDERENYLKEWKRLFEAIHPEMKVFVADDSPEFIMTKDFIYGHKDFDSYYWQIAILVMLPDREDFDQHWLVGLNYGQMFSDVEVALDTFVDENPGYPYQPKTKLWEEFYNELSEKMNKIKASVPRPPTFK